MKKVLFSEQPRGPEPVRFLATQIEQRDQRALTLHGAPKGRKQLAAQTSRWHQVVQAIGRILNPTPEER